MNRKIYKRLWLILLICLPLTIKGQAQSSISIEERMELEKKFSKLKTFYIDDDGTVVYNYESDETTKEEEVPSKAKQDRVKVTVNINEDGEYVVTKEQPNYSLTEQDTQLESIPENIQIKDTFENNRLEKEVETAKEVVSDTNKISGEALESDSVTTTSKRKILKRKEPTKTLEETALELEDLIAEYKRIQDQSKRRNNSLSSRLSGGVDNSIRKDYSHNLSDLDGGTEVNEEEIEPAYYINGVEVDASEFKKLKDENIRLKERRRNGDWWVQTK